MVRIPRAEPSLQPSIAMQPQAAGSGWGAPGRATVQLGNAIGSLGDALGDIAGGIDKEAIAEQDFNDKMLMLKTDNEMGLNQIEAQSTYSGTGDDYLPQRSEYYDTTTGGAISQMQPRNQQKAALFFEQRRGPYLERDATFGGKRRQDTLMTTIDDAVSTEYGKLATSPPEEFEDRFRQTIQATDAIISNAPLPDKLKDQIAGQAAERGLQIIQGLAEDPETAPEIIPKVLRMIEEPQNEIQGGALQSEPVPSEPLPEVPQGAEGVQGLQGSPSGPALPKPSKLGAGDVPPPQSAVTGQQPAPVQYRIIDKASPTHAERNKIFREGGVVINLDTNWAAKGKATSPMVVVPDNATKAQRQAAQSYAQAIADTYEEKFGVKMTPKVLTRSQNGRGRPSTIHTEPFSVNDEKAAAYFTSPEGAQRHAQILRETFGKVPGAVFSIPHDPTRKGDNGAVGPLGSEVDLARVVLAQLNSGDVPAQAQQFAQASKLGAGDIADQNGGRAPNTIPGEPQLVRGPELVRGEAPVRVADASGRFVPQKTQTWRSTDSQLRDLLIKNLKNFKRMETEAARKADRIADEKTKEARYGTEREGLELLYGRKLTREWVDQNGPLLSNESYSRFMSAVTPKTRTTDPNIHAGLLERADEKPEDVIAEALDAYGNGLLSEDAFEGVYRKAQKALRPDTRRPPWVSEYRNMVKRSIRPEPGDKTVDSMKTYGDALEKFDDFLDEQKAAGKEMDRKAVAAFAEQTVTEYKMSRVADKRKALSMPRFSQVSREAMTMDEVDRTVQATIEAAKSGKLRPEELKLEAANLRKWKETLEAEAVARGEKIPAKPMAKREQQQPQKPAAKPQGETNSGGGDFPEPMRLGGPKEGDKQPQNEAPESRPLGGALGVVPFAENADGSVSLSVPGMILEPWRAFKRGWARMGQVGQMDESGQMYTASDAARDSTDDAITASGMPLAATSFGTAAKTLAGRGATVAREAVAPEVPASAVTEAAPTVAKEAAPVTASTEAGTQGFTSGLDKALQGFKPTDSVTAETLAKRGVKKAEIEARGMADLLADGKSAKVSDLQKVAGENRVEVREAGNDLALNNSIAEELEAAMARHSQLTSSGRKAREDLGWSAQRFRKGEWTPASAAEIADVRRELSPDLLARIKLGKESKPKWQSYSLDPDNPTYRETVLHLPAAKDDTSVGISRAVEEAKRHIRAAGRDPEEWGYTMPEDYVTLAVDQFGMERPQTYYPHFEDVSNRLRSSASQDFQSGHWSEPNVLSHARTSIQKDAQGKDVFVVNELQSDWGQKIRDSGVAGTPEHALKVKAAEAAYNEARDAWKKVEPEHDRLLARMQDLKPVADSQPSLLLSRSKIDNAKAEIDNLRKPWLEMHRLKERFHLTAAELDTLNTAAPGHPLVNTTDQWVNTGLRKMIMQAVESGSDQIAIPSGATVKSFGMGGKEDGIKYAYDEMYPKNLRNILKKLDPSIEPVKVDHLYGQKGNTLERSNGFITFKITPKLREAVKKEGMPLFSGGVPVDGSDRGEAE